MYNCKAKDQIVTIQTSYGDIKVKLFDETPLHKDNFLKKANEGYFDELTFHRVIKDFMIQGGGAKSPKNERETVDAEIKFPEMIHKRGTLAAARWGDDVNPEKASDAGQFYIVTGKTFSDEKLSEFEKQRFERLRQATYNKIQSESMDVLKALYKEGNKTAMNELRESWRTQADKIANEAKPKTLYSTEQREIYKTIGGTPHLDGEYTIFGEVLEGMDVVDKIQNVETNEYDKPLKPIVLKVFIDKQK